MWRWLAFFFARHSFVLLWIHTVAGKECLFPAYVQSVMNAEGEPLPWHTRTLWLNLRNEPKLREIEEVFVVRSQIWGQRQKNRWSCERHEKRLSNRATSQNLMFGTCTETSLLYNRTCLSAENNMGIYKVIQYGGNHGTPMFLCMKFVRRSDGVIQVLESQMSDRNDPDLCEERQLHQNTEAKEWPWIAPWKRSKLTCPISGGFSFRTINKLTNQDFCGEEWRKSRLEIDCASGDGLRFIAPSGTQCNPFSSTQEATRLFCWAGWHEWAYTFLVVGDESGTPKFCLRFPRDMSGDQFSVYVYFSVMCPMQENGMPPTGIEYHELLMTKLDGSNCEDDDVKRCENVARRGQCKKGEKYAMHCEKSCNMCEERSDTLQSVCLFESAVRGKWIFSNYNYNNPRIEDEDVYINKTTMHFERFGDFRCISRRHISNLYKTVTQFNNGCSMRYTCFEIRQPSPRNTNVIQFRVGQSYRADLDFEGLCKFEDDPLDVPGLYRGSSVKNLIFNGHLWDAFCGLSGSIPFNGTVYGERCSGFVSDWDSDGCVRRGLLSVRSDTCSNLIEPLEYQCLVFVEEEMSFRPLEQYIITKSSVGHYNCWVLTSYACDHWNWPHGRVLYKLDTAQCQPFSEDVCAVDRTPEAILFLRDDERTNYCRTPLRSHYRSHSTTTSFLTNIQYSPDGSKNGDGGFPKLNTSGQGVYLTPSVFQVNSGHGGRENMHSRTSMSIATGVLFCKSNDLVLTTVILVSVTFSLDVWILPT